MAQKINPLSLRLRKTNRNFDSSWFNDSNYVSLLMRDLKIQLYINLILKKLKYCSARYLIQNLPNKIKIHIFFCNPDKSRRHMSKIFYLSYTKKIKKSKKNFFNIAQTGISHKQNKIFQYLITNFSEPKKKRSFFQASNKVGCQVFFENKPSFLKKPGIQQSCMLGSGNLLETIENPEYKTLYSNDSINLGENIFNLNNMCLFKNYLKLVFSIKKYNQFYLRYFLIKYFSIKFPTNTFNKKKNNFFSLATLNNISKSSIFEPTLHLTEDLSKKRFFNEGTNCLAKLEKPLLKNETQFKQQQNVLFFYIMNFLFFKVYKDKNFLALNYFQIKKNNYKIIKDDYNDLFNKQVKFFKKTWHTAKLDGWKNNSSVKINLNNFSLTDSSLNLSTTFFFNNLVTTKLKILSFLKKLELKHKYFFSSAATSNKKICSIFYDQKVNVNKKSLKQTNFNMLNKLHKNSILTFTSFTNFIKLNENYKSLHSYNEKNNSIKCFSTDKSNKKRSFFQASNKVGCQVFFENKPKGKVEKSFVGRQLVKIEDKIISTELFYQLQNQKYYAISLINNQSFNDTYNSYCKLSESYKYYNKIFSNHNLNYYNNLNSLNNLIKDNKKLTLISSPYKYHMESVLCNSLSCNINFNFFQSINIFQNAFFFIDEIIYYLEKRVAFFKIKNYILKKLTEQKSLRIKGIRVTCSGRIGGKSKKAQRSKIQNFKYGETSLHVFSSKIDFKSKTAFTSFGTLGIKTWICYH